MKKFITAISVIIGLICVGFIGRCFYMVAYISCTSPPIKIYEYYGDISQLNSSFESFVVIHPNTSFKFSRRDSSAKTDDGDRDLEIQVRNNVDTLTYGFVCEKNKSSISLEMVSAFKNNRYGGYIAGAPNISKLVDSFENNIVIKLKKEQYTDLKSE